MIYAGLSIQSPTIIIDFKSFISNLRKDEANGRTDLDESYVLCTITELLNLFYSPYIHCYCSHYCYKLFYSSGSLVS